MTVSEVQHSAVALAVSPSGGSPAHASAKMPGNMWGVSDPESSPNEGLARGSLEATPAVTHTDRLSHQSRREQETKKEEGEREDRQTTTDESRPTASR